MALPTGTTTSSASAATRSCWCSRARCARRRTPTRRSAEESFSFDEHLLERISILEEAVKRTAETVRQLLGALHKQEKNILINQTGLSALRELLEQKKYIGWEEWSELWESKMDYQLLALEKRERFLAIKERIAALYHGDKRKLFLQHLEDAEYALFAFDIERAVAALEAAYKLDRDNYELAYFLGETHFNEANSDAGADLLLPRAGGQAGPLRGAGLQRRHPLRAGRPRRAPRST